MSVRELLRSTSQTLQQAGCDAPRLNAELLLVKVLGCDQAWLIAHADDNVSSSILETYLDLVERRRRREPLAYITGEKEFWSRLFFVTRDVLIPRPETEHLIESVLEHCPNTRKEFRFCDIGTGSGCIAVTLACEYSQATVVATDISHDALHIAQQNAIQHDVTSRIKLRQGDLFGALRKEDGLFDVIVSNPPYIAKEEMDTLGAELDFEPRYALTDEANGLSYLEHLVEAASKWLKPGSCLIVETGTCGLPSASPCMQLECEIMDLAGHLRGGVFVCQRT